MLQSKITMASSRVSLSRLSSSSSSSSMPHPKARRFSAQQSTSSVESTAPKTNTRWKPMCLYFTQSLCNKMDDPNHLSAFNHSFSEDLNIRGSDLKNVRPQPFDSFLVLDLEGKVEILEFPVLMIDAKTLEVVDFFHRFVRPSKMSEERINNYIEGKYGKMGLQSVWHDTAIPFNEVIQQFEDWLAKHQLWVKDSGSRLNKAAFVTCGNWDIKTKIPEQCKVNQMQMPSYFMEWMNLKDVFLNFYNRRATGMVTMMRELRMPLIGSHHLGIDDTKNIARVLQRMIIDGAILQITARRSRGYPESVEFLFKNRIRRFD